MADYLEIDFNSFKTYLIDILKENDTFKDYNFEGANITMLLELLSYMMEFNTYYQNKIVQNLYSDTATLYNTVHRIVGHKGYIPKGHISAYTTLSISISGDYTGTQLYIPEYSIFTTEEGMNFINTNDKTITVPTSASNPVNIELPIKEGKHERLTYTGKNMVDYSIILPTINYDNDTNETNEAESIKVYVNDEQWTRVNNFFEEISGLSTNDNVFTFQYNKYQNYVVNFSSSRNYPSPTDDIVIDLIQTSGEDGSVGSNLITEAEEPFIINLDTNETLPLDNISITNEESTRYASNPETIDIIKRNADAHINRQYRCVRPDDFSSYLEERADISTANVWGEKEIAPSGNVLEYNKIHLSVIPDEWKSSTISVETSAWEPDPEIGYVDIHVPMEYSNNFKSSIAEYIEPRKIMNSFEIYEIPNLVYFYFDIGIEVKRMYNFNNVSNTIKDKLLYYFNPLNRNFGEIIDFREIQNYILDTNETSSDNSFDLVRGIKSFVFRDIILSTGIYEYQSNNYPQYNLSAFDTSIDNVLRPIKLWYDQFPYLIKDTITITNEG